MSQATDLERLAQPLFGTFSRAEKAMLEKAVVGRTAYCGASNKADDPLNDPKDSDTWDQGRHIRAELLRWLFADEGAKKLIDPRGVRVDSAWIEGELSLSFIKAPFQLELLRCRLKGGCRLNLTEIPRVDLTGSWMEFISADHAVVKGDVLLKFVVCVGREVALNGARIGGSLNCDGAQFKNPAKKDVRQSGIALNAVAARIGGAVLFREKFRAEGLVRLYCAQIEGNLECDSGWFENPAEAESKQRWSGLALDLGALKVTGTVSLRKGFTAKGAVNLDYATIGGPLDCDGGTFENAARKDMAQTGVALRARGAKVAGSISLRSNIADKGSFSAKGIVHLYRAEIGGDLECDGGSFENPAQKDVEGTGTALHAGATKIGGSVLLRASPGGRCDFSAKGAVLLAGSEIKGN
jgi:hypothetical protein